MIDITLISDTHSKHSNITDDLNGGDILIHAGDISEKGYVHEVKNFLGWFDNIVGYDHKIFIAGNHDFLFEQQSSLAKGLVDEYDSITYLFDESVDIYTPDYENKIKIYGSPWQPWFHNWAFNLPRGGEKLKQRWSNIPDDTDILITHGPVKNILDFTSFGNLHVGSDVLNDIIWNKKPKMHVCGHIHDGHGYKEIEDIHFFNASILNDAYELVYKPIKIKWDNVTNEIEFV